MPKLKRSVKSAEVKTGFEAYDGPTPKGRGIYRAILKQCDLKEYKTGAQGYRLLFELDAAKGDPKDHAKYDGFPIWMNLVFGDHESMIARESNFYNALGVKDEPDVVFDSGELTDGVKVKTIGGKNPLGVVVNLDIKQSKYEGEERPEVDGVFKHSGKGEPKPDFVVADEPDEDEDEADEEEVSYDDREAELKSLTIADLRHIAESDYDLDVKGLKKADLVEAILDEEFGVDGVDESEEDEEDEDEEEDDVEIDDEEEDDEDEEEDEDDDDRAAELGALDRAALKAIIKEHDANFRVLKSMTDEDLVSAILEIESVDEKPF